MVNPNRNVIERDQRGHRAMVGLFEIDGKKMMRKDGILPLYREIDKWLTCGLAVLEDSDMNLMIAHEEFLN